MDAVFGWHTAQVGGYRLLYRLGGGGFGEVYYGEHVNSRTPAAVKLMHAELLDSYKESEYRQRFAREVEFLSQLHHPAVPRLFAAEPHASRPWLATEYVAGPTLSHLVEKHGPLPVGAVRALAIRVAEVLELLHSIDRAHRDLNPRNVLVTPNGPHVIDFGLARAVGAQPMTRTGEAVGTLLYMPPERPGTAKGTQYDVAGDVFGLGAIALFAATGHPPYKNYAALRAGRVDLRGVPAELEVVLRRLLAEDPEERPSTVAAKLALRTSNVPGAPLPTFAEGLSPAHRRMLEEHPVRPVPSGGDPQDSAGPGDRAEELPDSTDAARIGAPPTEVPRDAVDRGADEVTELITVIGPGPFATEFRRPPRRSPSSGPRTERREPGTRAARRRVARGEVTEVWDRPLADWVQYVAATPDGTVLVATADGMLTAMDGHTGYFRWEQRLPGGLYGTPVTDDNLVHAGSADGWLNTLDTTTLRLTDRRRVDGRVIGCAVAPGRVVAATSGGVVWCFPSGYGAADWSEPVGAPITAGPALVGRVVYVADARGRLHALDLDDGGEAWPHAPELHERPLALTVCGDLLLAAGADGGLHAFGAADGVLRWKARTAVQAWACSADATSNTVYTGTLDGVVRTYNAATGAKTSELSVATGIRRSLVHVDGCLVVGGTDGGTRAVDPVGGQEVWRYAAAGPVYAPAAAVPGGPVVIGRLDGMVCALPPP
jgi:serine/threonine protein kinase/outer membrane protein assembly factor BamB